MANSKDPRNTQQQVIDYLLKNPCKTEKEIQLNVWGYNRQKSGESNKKYADVLRRAYFKGKIDRVRVQFKNKDTRKYWYYFVPFGHHN
jgi:hypothetical protein